MKKIVIAALATIALAASAAEVTVSSVRDYTGTDTNGYRVATQVAGLGLSATHIDNKYNRFAVGKDIQVAKLGPVALSAGGAGVYQSTNTVGGVDGYGLTVGAKASVALAKSVDLVAGVERFYGQDRVKQFNGNVGSVGLNIKF